MSTEILILSIVSLGSLLFAGKPQSKEHGDMTTVKGNQQATTAVIEQPITGNEDLGDLSA